MPKALKKPAKSVKVAKKPAKTAAGKAKSAKKTKEQILLGKINLVVEEQIRPFLHADGGDMEIIELHKDGTLDVQLVGACGGCASAAMTLTFGIQRILDEQFPEENIQINPL